MTIYIKYDIIIIIELLGKENWQKKSRANNFVYWVKGGKEMLMKRLEFEREEIRKCWIKRIISTIIVALIFGGILWCYMEVIKTTSLLEGCWWLYMFCCVSMVVNYGIISIIWSRLMKSAKECMENNIRKFDFSMKVDNLFECLEKAKTLELKLNIIPSQPKLKESLIELNLNQNLRYYAKIEGIRSLYIWARDEKTDEETEIGTTEDYKSFFSYFELKENVD